MTNIKKLLPGFLPFAVAMAIMYSISFAVAIAYVLYSMVWQKAQGFADFYGRSMGSLTLLATACMHLVYVLVYALWFRRVRRRSEEVQKQSLGVKDIVLLIAAGVMLQIVISFLLDIFLPLFPGVMADYEALIDSMELGTGLLPVVLTGVIAPVGEELIFRGVTMALLDVSFPFAFVNTLQALLFGIYHMNVVQFCYAFLLGLMLGLVWKKYHNLRACIVLHATVNLSANILSLLG